MNTVEVTDTELSILETIYLSQKKEREVKQRELATRANLSLGMTNALLKRFAEKGWITVRRINTRNIQYAITPDGVSEIMRRAVGYFHRTITNVNVYKDMIEDLITTKRRKGYSGIILLGPSDLEFLVEYACQKQEMLFMKSADPAFRPRRPLSGRYLYLAAEGESPGSHDDSGGAEDTVYLATLFARAP